MDPYVSFVRRLAAVALAALLPFGIASAQTEVPSVKLQSGTLVSASNWWANYPSGTLHTPGVAAAPVVAPEIVELANALSEGGVYTGTSYAGAVYEYVRNNIEIEFRFGLGKGARGAIVDQSGTAFDQAALMVALLQQGSVTASYQAGTVTLTPTQFTSWTGITTAGPACQFLADGGIPATVNGQSSCSSLSGTTPISSVVMAHIWVVVGSTIYDPAYKAHVVKAGIGTTSLGTHLGCGTSCGTNILNLIPGPQSSGITGVSSITGVPQSQIESALSGYAQALQTWIQGQNTTLYATAPNMQVEDLLGGMIVDISQPTTSGTLLPTASYSGTSTLLWSGSGGIPNQYRTTLTIQFGPPGALAFNRLTYADETAGSSLRILLYPVASTSTAANVGVALYSDYMLLDGGTVANQTTPWIPLTLVVQHPYVPQAGTYLNETLTFNPIAVVNNCSQSFCPAGCSAAPSSCPSGDYWPAQALTIVEGWGDATESTVAHFGALALRDQTHTPTETLSPQNTNLTSTQNIYPYWRAPGGHGISACKYQTPPTGPSMDPGCRETHQSPLAASWLAQSSRATRLAAGINSSVAQLHHSLGVISSGQVFPGQTFIDVQTSMSVNSQSATSTDRTAAYLGDTALLNRLEGSVIEQQGSSWEGGSAVSMMAKSNTSLYGHTPIPFYDITAANVSNAFNGGLNWGTLGNADITQYTNAGYELIIPNNPVAGSYCDSGGYCAMLAYNALVAFGNTSGQQNNRVAYITNGAGWDKGSAGPSDPADLVTQQSTIQDYSVKGKNRFSVSLATGDLSFAPPADLVTGDGQFPYSLSFQRYYAPSGGGFACTNLGGVQTIASACYRTATEISGLPYGWTHSLAVTARLVNDGFASLGRSSALDASTAIAALYVSRQLNATASPSFQSRLATIFVTNWLGENLIADVVVVRRPPNQAEFVRLPDGSFNSAPGNAEVLTQTGTRSYDGQKIAWNNNGLLFSLREKGDSTLTFSYGASLPSSRTSQTLYLAQTWSFPFSINLTFTYGTVATGVGNDSAQCLASVSNNIGRSLTFNNNCTSGGTSSTVVDDAGRQITLTVIPSTLYGRDGTGGVPIYTPADSVGVTALRVTAPDLASTSEYDYVPPPTTSINRSYYRAYTWATPLETAAGSTPIVTAAFDSLYRIHAITDNSLPTGFTTTFFTSGLYGTENQKRGEMLTPANVNEVTTSYFDRWNHEIEDIDPLGRITSRTFDAQQRLATLTRPQLDFDSYAYDARSNLLSTVHTPKPGSVLSATSASSTYSEGPTVTSANCANPPTCNQPATTTDANTNVTNYAYVSTTGLVQRITGPLVSAQVGGVSGNAETDYCYGAFGLLSASIIKADNATNRVKAYAYNSSNHYVLNSVWIDPTQSYVPPTTAGGACTTTTKSGALNLLTSYTFDAVGNIGTVTDPRLNQASYLFDAERRLTTVSAPLGAVTRYCYDADGQLTTTVRATASGFIDPNAASASGLTSNGQCPTAYSVSSTQSEARTYYPTGDLLSVTDASGNVIVHAHDADGREQIVQDPDGRQTASVYDLAGQQIATWKGGTNWLTGSGSTTAPSPTNAPSSGTSWVPGTYVSTAPLRYAAYTYTNNGKQLSVTDADNHQTGYYYDGLDRLRFTFFPNAADGSRCSAPANDGGTPTCTLSAGSTPLYEQSGYDSAGNRLAFRTRKGDSIGTQYDAMNRATTKTPPAQGVVTTGYDLSSKPLEVSKAAFGGLPAHTTIYTYDPAGRKQTEANDGRTVTYGYDLSGNRNLTTWPDSYSVSYVWDALNRMSTATENPSTLLALYCFDTLSRRTALYFGSQGATCANGGGTNSIGYGYAPNNYLSQVNDALLVSASMTTVGFTLGRNNSGQIKSLTLTDPSFLPARITANNSYAVDSLNEYTTAFGQSPTYDLNGNLLTWYQNGALQTNSFDTDNRLTQVVNSSSTTTFDYDGIGRRVSKTSAGTTTLYLLDGDEEIAELNSGGSVLRRYVTGPAIDDRIAHIEGTGGSTVRTFYHVNYRDSVIAMTDGVGNLQQKFAYDEYGLSSSVGTGEAFRYAGRRWDLETGLYYYRARYYSPQLGRFLQTDPIGYKDDTNLYAYVGNDPLDRTDPTGQIGELEGAGCAITIEVGCAPGAIVGAIIDAAIVVGGIWAIHKTGPHDHALQSKAAEPKDKPSSEPKEKPSAPPGNGGTTETPHGSPEHDAEVNRQVDWMRDNNYGDIRKNQAQVDADGNKVGDNRPDVQGTNPQTGQREHVEVDRDPKRGAKHEADIKRNDPNAKCTLIRCPMK